MLVSVIVPTFNDRAALQACLESLTRQTSSDLEVLACVDGSSDGTVEYLQSAAFPFAVQVLEHADRQNHGRAAARNLALPHVRGEIVLFLDADMRLAPDAVDRHLALMNARDCVSVGDVAYTNARDNLWARYLQTRGAGKAVDGSDVGPMAFHTANSAVRASGLAAVGGFDASMTSYGGEDTEFAMRLAELGRAFVCNRSARASATETKSVSVGLDQRRAFAEANLPGIMARHPNGPAPFWVDRIDSPRWRDRALRGLMNPVSDLLADVAVRVPIFALQRRALDYKVLRTVWAGYRAGTG